MSKFDLIIVLVVLIFMILGYYKGLVRSILSVVQYFAVIVLSIKLAPAFSKFLIEKFSLDLTIVEWIKNNENMFSEAINLINNEILKNFAGRIINVLSIIILFIVLKIVFGFAISILNKVTNLPILNAVNRLGGLILGAVNGILVVYIISLLINWLPLASIAPIRVELNSSIAGAAVNSFVPEVTSEVISLVDVTVLNEKE